MKPEEIEAIRKKFYLQDDGKTADDQCSLLSVGEARTLLSALEKAQRDRDQASEAVQVLRDGKPLGPLVGSHTIVNQALEIRGLTKELEAAQAKLAAAEDHIRYQADANSALFKQSQEYWQDRENAAKLLESAQEENRRLREALEMALIDFNSLGFSRPARRIEQALARPEKEGGG